MEVIILNGASCSGKSSIARELQSILPDNYLHIGIDTFIAMMPKKANRLLSMDEASEGFYFKSESADGKKIQRIQSGKYGKQINNVYHTTVKHLADSGLKVIVDDVMNGKVEQDDWDSVLGNTETLYIGVECSPSILAQRENLRADRIQGAAEEQAARVHKGVKYGLIVSTSTNSAKECAQIIATHITNRSN